MINDIKITNLTSLVTLKISRDKHTSNDYVLGEVEFGQVEGKANTYKYVNQIGEDVNAITLETRDVEINGWVIGKTEDEMTNRKMVLNALVNPQQGLKVEYSTYYLIFYPSSSIIYSPKYKDNNEVICSFKIRGTAYDPCFYDGQINETEAGAVTGMFHFPLIISSQLNPETIIYGVLGVDKFFYISNIGNVRTGMELEIKVEGIVRNPKIINVSTLGFIQINKVLQDETIIINTEVGKRSIISKKIVEGVPVEENYFKYRSFDSTWLQIPLGYSTFTYSSDEPEVGETAGTMSVKCKYFNRYLEVQKCQ